MVWITLAPANSFLSAHCWQRQRSPLHRVLAQLRKSSALKQLQMLELTHIARVEVLGIFCLFLFLHLLLYLPLLLRINLVSRITLIIEIPGQVSLSGCLYQFKLTDPPCHCVDEVQTGSSALERLQTHSYLASLFLTATSSLPPLWLYVPRLAWPVPACSRYQ